MTLLIKICGLRTPEALDAALTAGADMVGFVFFPPSPRNVGVQAARVLGKRVRGRAQKVALSVDATNAELALAVEALKPDLLQLHGKETPERVAEVKARTGLPVMKALGIATARDVVAAAAYERVADMLLFDAKPPEDATRPGGNALAFDWSLMRAYAGPLPWMLAGGLTRANVVAAIKASGARMVDVSSGVETRPGQKSPAKIRSFLAAVDAAQTA